ncbi:hypothetical protein LTR86_011062 [Recurvomyces mirabilis]|nr:hypothetical protein LTR86_011062 [Recurvomyces mirabilis]
MTRRQEGNRLNGVCERASYESWDSLAWPVPPAGDSRVARDAIEVAHSRKLTTEVAEPFKWSEQYPMATSSLGPEMALNQSAVWRSCTSCAVVTKVPSITQFAAKSPNPEQYQGYPFASNANSLSQHGFSPPRRPASPRDFEPKSEAEDELQRAEAQYYLAKEKATAALKHQSESKRHNSATPRSLRVPHKVIERRYRHNLKSNLDVLSAKLPTLDNFCDSTLNLEDSNRYLKAPSKAAVITAAVKYIEELETKAVARDEFTVRRTEFISSLQLQVSTNA